MQSACTRIAFASNGQRNKNLLQYIKWDLTIHAVSLLTDTPDMSTRPRDPLADYEAHMREHGIDRAIVVHPEPCGPSIAL